MSKYALFGVLMAWLLMATYIVDSFSAYTGDDSFSVENPINDISTEGDNDSQKISSMVSTFFSAMTLQVTGLPNILALIMFTVPSFILMFMTLEITIKILDAVIPF